MNKSDDSDDGESQFHHLSQNAPVKRKPGNHPQEMETRRKKKCEEATPLAPQGIQTGAKPDESDASENQDVASQATMNLQDLHIEEDAKPDEPAPENQAAEIPNDQDEKVEDLIPYEEFKKAVDDLDSREEITKYTLMAFKRLFVFYAHKAKNLSEHYREQMVRLEQMKREIEQEVAKKWLKRLDELNKRWNERMQILSEMCGMPWRAAPSEEMIALGKKLKEEKKQKLMASSNRMREYFLFLEAHEAKSAGESEVVKTDEPTTSRINAAESSDSD